MVVSSILMSGDTTPSGVNPAEPPDPSRTGFVLSILAGVLLVAAAIFLVSAGLGEYESTSSTGSGTEVTVRGRTPSLYRDSPTAAIAWVAVAVVAAGVAVTAIRRGGRTGALVVASVMVLFTLAAIMTIGVFFVPATITMTTAAVLTVRAHDRSPTFGE